MALDFLSKFSFFNKLNARARIFVLVGAVVGAVLLVYIGTRLISSGTGTIGPSRVASTPQGLQSIPGGQLTPEYQRAVMQANEQAARQAKLTGTSAVPTMINPGGQQQTANCVVCTDQSPNVKNNLDDWVRRGELSPDVANQLQQLADKNVSVEDYAAALNDLVKQGKLTPEQARALLEQYKKQHANNLLQDSAKVMDTLIKNGQLPLETANLLLNSQKSGVSPSDYAAQLQDLVRQGKVSPEVAQQLLAQYTQQRAKEIIMRSIASLRQMARNGEITDQVANELVPLEESMVPVDVYGAKLNGYVTGGKMTPAAATKILNEFKQQKAEIGPTESIMQLLKKAEAAAFAEIADLIKTGKMPQEVGAQLTALIQRDVSFDDFKAAIDTFVQQKKITPDIAKLKLADYRQVKGLRDLQKKLAGLQGNNASGSDYADALRRAVQAGALTPEEAAQLMQEYAATTSNAPLLTPAVASTAEFAQLQQQLQQTSGAAQAVPASEFETAQTQAETESAADRQNRIQAMIAAMQGQAGQLVSSWQPPTMAHKEGTPDDEKDKDGKTTTTTTTASAGKTTTKTDTTTDQPTGPPLIKSGSILFAVLDTAANSDYPDSPILATIVDGKYKGAKLLGKLVTTKGVSGQMDRISMNFTLMNMDQWDKSKTVTAYAIDPDTARTVMASDVDYHYMQRFGAIMATSFLQGYGTAVTTSGSNTTTGIFGTSNTYPELSPANKIAAALGQMGTTLGKTTENYVNIPPTVRVDSGVGLGILFMSDVT